MMNPESSAILFLLLALAVPALVVLVSIRRTDYSPLQFLLWCTAILLTRLLWRARLPQRWPPEVADGAVIVCNHRSSVDPFFFQVCCTRPMHWMVAREYCEHPAFAWFLRACEVIPVNRGGVDTASTKAAIRLAAQGDLVGMFPEGRINQSRDLMMPVRPGAVLVALRARKPILPCYIHGSPFRGTPWSPLFMTARVQLHFGRVLDLSPYYDREHDDKLVRQIMTDALQEIARLADCPDYVPRFAGRRWKPTAEELALAGKHPNPS